MISEFKELVVLPMAMILFLCAASTLPSLTWRGDPPTPIAFASRQTGRTAPETAKAWRAAGHHPWCARQEYSNGPAAFPPPVTRRALPVDGMRLIRPAGFDL